MNTPPLRILIFAHDAALYGASLSLLTILEHLSKDDSFKILVLLPRPGKFEKRLDALKIDYKIIPYRPCITMQSEPLINKVLAKFGYYIREHLTIPMLKTIANQFEPDLIYTNTSIVSIGYKLSRKLRIPHIWHIREYGDSDHLFQYLPTRKLVTRKIKNSDISVFITTSLRSHWVNSKIPKYKVIYNGVIAQNSNDILPKTSSKIHKFGLLGIIAPHKGQEVAILGFSNLVKQFPSCELHFYGDNIDKHYFNYLQKLTSELKCTAKIKFHPYIENNRLIYNSLTIVLCCSVSEAFGRTIAEAMSYGIPVIANANGGPSEIIDDGIDGLLYNKTPESLAKKMKTLVSDPVLYEKISNNSFIKAREQFSVERYVNEVSLLFKSSVRS